MDTFLKNANFSYLRIWKSEFVGSTAYHFCNFETLKICTCETLTLGIFEFWNFWNSEMLKSWNRESRRRGSKNHSVGLKNHQNFGYEIHMISIENHEIKIWEILPISYFQVRGSLSPINNPPTHTPRTFRISSAGPTKSKQTPKYLYHICHL